MRPKNRSKMNCGQKATGNMRDGISNRSHRQARSFKIRGQGVGIKVILKIRIRNETFLGFC
jgi:hypothetical protein